MNMCVRLTPFVKLHSSSYFVAFKLNLNFFSMNESLENTRYLYPLILNPKKKILKALYYFLLHIILNRVFLLF